MTQKPMQGKTIVITGATNGIGMFAAGSLAKLGATVVLVGRNAKKTDSVIADITAAGGDARKAIADMSSQKDIYALAEHLLANYPQIDALLNNAGAMFTPRQETVDGIEMTFALNHLGYFLLTDLLMDRLKASAERAPVRIVNVASEASRGARFHFDDIELKRGYSAIKAYAQSKLANIAYSFELARRLAGTNITVNAMHPGFVGTGFARNNAGLQGLAMSMGMVLLKPFILSVEKGADTLVWLASSPEMTGQTGGYYQRRRLIRAMEEAHSKEAQARLWAISEGLIRAQV